MHRGARLGPVDGQPRLAPVAGGGPGAVVTALLFNLGKFAIGWYIGTQKLHIKVVGLARIAADVTPELALATIGSITVLGALQASPSVRSALAERIH